jgi:hypothetical protein
MGSFRAAMARCKRSRKLARMNRAFLASLTLALTLFVATTSHAQTTPRVQVVNFTVDGDPPPDQYRQMLADGIRPTLAEVERCYNARLAVNPRLQGDFGLRLWVSARQVIRATAETSIGDTTLEECARAAIRQFTLPPQAPEGGASVRFIVRFTAPPPGTVPPAPVTVTPTQPAPIAPPARVAAVPPRVQVRVATARGPLDASGITTALPGAALEQCANGAVGDMPMNIAVSRRGVVSASAARGATIRDRALSRCVVLALRTMTVPTTAAGTRAQVVVTFTR